MIVRFACLFLFSKTHLSFQLCLDIAEQMLIILVVSVYQCGYALLRKGTKHMLGQQFFVRVSSGLAA